MLRLGGATNLNIFRGKYYFFKTHPPTNEFTIQEPPIRMLLSIDV